MCEAAQAYLHILVFVDVYVDGAKLVANAFDLGSVVRHKHILLLYVVQLLPELKIARRRVHGEMFLKIFPRLVGRLGISNVAKHVVVDK